MAFWGVELKHEWPAAIGPNNQRLHVSAATLGSYDETSTDIRRKTKVECKFGKDKTVLLCCLEADKSETCQIHVEFEESMEVVFRVISGTRTVHLIGYYTSPSDALEPPGIDLGEYDTENSDDSQGNSEYGGSFIVPDDDPLSAGESNENMPKVSRPRLKKKYHARDSDETPRQKDFAAKEQLLWDSDPDDQMLISSHSRTKCASNAPFPAKEKGDVQPKRKRGEDEPMDQAGTQNQLGEPIDQTGTQNQLGEAIDQNATQNQVGEAIDQNATQNQVGEAIDQNVTQNQVGEAIDQNVTQNQVGEPIDQNETQNQVGEAIDQNETQNEVNDRKSKKKKMCKDEEGGATEPYVAEMETTTTTKP